MPLPLQSAGPDACSRSGHDSGRPTEAPAAPLGVQVQQPAEGQEADMPSCTLLSVFKFNAASMGTSWVAAAALFNAGCAQGTGAGYRDLAIIQAIVAHGGGGGGGFS